MIRAEPKQFDMTDWFVSGYSNPDGTMCGTSACIAGFACIAHARATDYGKKKRNLRDIIEWLMGRDDSDAPLQEVVGYCPEPKALGWLEITKDQGSMLFYTCSWPEPFRRDYDMAQSGCEKNGYKPDRERMAEVACNRIDYFIKEGK